MRIEVPGATRDFTRISVAERPSVSLCLPIIRFFLKTLTLPASADRVSDRCDPSSSRCS